MYAGKTIESRTRHAGADCGYCRVSRRHWPCHCRCQPAGSRARLCWRPAAGARPSVAVRRLYPLFRIEGHQAPGGPGADAVWQVHRHPTGTRLLFCTPLQRGAEPGRQNQAGPERRCGQQRQQNGGKNRQRHRYFGRKENFLKGNDAQQLPAENQRPPGQPRGNRHRRHVAGGGYRQGGVQRGQL